jgi:hypothetical protein
MRDGNNRDRKRSEEEQPPTSSCREIHENVRKRAGLPGRHATFSRGAIAHVRI